MAVTATDIKEHMHVHSSDNQHLGTVDRVEGDRIKLTKSDPKAGGEHHYVPLSDVGSVQGDRVMLSKTAEQARPATGGSTSGTRGASPGSPNAGP